MESSNLIYDVCFQNLRHFVKQNWRINNSANFQIKILVHTVLYISAVEVLLNNIFMKNIMESCYIFCMMYVFKFQYILLNKIEEKLLFTNFVM